MWDNYLQWDYLKCILLASNYYNNVPADDSNWFCETYLSKIFPFNSKLMSLTFVVFITTRMYTNNINTEIIKNVRQLMLVNKLNICDNDIQINISFTAIVILVILTFCRKCLQ